MAEIEMNDFNLNIPRYEWIAGGESNRPLAPLK